VRHSFLKHKNAPLVASASSLLAKQTSDKLTSAQAQATSEQKG